MIAVDIKTGRMLVNYKGQTATGQFTNNTLKNMVKGIRFEKSLTDFLTAIAQLIKQVCQENQRPK
jgi:hypothetical protein